jgi:single-strand DNA-binding protein
MDDLNRVTLIGRLSRDSLLKFTSNGQAYCKFSIAVNRRVKKGETKEDVANFFDIVVWGKQAETLHPYLQKSKMIAVHGELRQERWQQDGQSRSKVEIVADYIMLLGGRHDDALAAASYANNSESAEPQQSTEEEGFANDIPF